MWQAMTAEVLGQDRGMAKGGRLNLLLCGKLRVHIGDRSAETVHPHDHPVGREQDYRNPSLFDHINVPV